jgi:hypothetical protein
MSLPRGSALILACAALVWSACGRGEPGPSAGAGAADASHAQSAPSLQFAFVVDLDMTGGFTGLGRGGVTVDSDGRARAARIGGVNREASECGAQLEGDDLQSLQRAVAAARLQSWPATFAPAGDTGCCDRVTWTLRLAHRDADDRAQTSATMWYDGNEDRLPKEIAAITDVAVRVLARTLADCRGRANAARARDQSAHRQSLSYEGTHTP